jgi:3-hydroxyisobutyrate dehydrogenase
MFMSQLRITFLGLGTMGAGMARRLLAAGFPLTVFNRNPDRAAPFAAAGARVASTPRAAASGAEVIISIVSDDQASRAIWLGPDGALAGAAAGVVCVESSTLTVDWVRELGAAVREKGAEFVDAPVTGSKPQAAAGELNFLVGGSTATIERIRPMLAAMSKNIIVAGPSGSGALLKLINNFVCGTQTAALAEALVLAERSGLERDKVLEVLTLGAAGSPMVKTVAARMAASDFTPNFQVKLIAKDLRYACAEGKKVSLELLTAAAALEEFQRAIAAGQGERDIAAVLESVRQRS